MSKKNQPYLALYVQDFMTDAELSQCSASATGVYIRIMCLLTKTPEYGRLLLKQKYKQTPKQTPSKRSSKTQAGSKLLLETCLAFASQLEKHLPYDWLTIKHGVYELVNEGVLQIDGEYLVQKRMVKDAKISNQRALAGSKGGLSRVKNEKVNTSDFAYSFAQAKVKAKSKQNAYIDNDNKEIYNEGGAGGKNEVELKNIPEPIVEFYSHSLEDLQGFGKSLSENVTQEDLDDWKGFVRMIDTDDNNFHTDVFIANKFIFPADMSFLKKKGFNKDLWVPLLQKILSVGLEPKHNLRFRILDPMKWLKTGNSKINTISTSVKTAGDGASFAKNSFE